MNQDVMHQVVAPEPAAGDKTGRELPFMLPNESEIFLIPGYYSCHSCNYQRIIANRKFSFKYNNSTIVENKTHYQKVNFM